MIDLLISLLNENKNVSDYEIKKINKNARELFYVLKKLEINRAVETENISCTVYVNTDDSTGSSTINIVASDNKTSIKKKINMAVNKAKATLNKAYKLPEADKNIKKVFKKKPDLNDIALKCANAVFKADKYKEGYINSTEIFVSDITEEFISSKGIHHQVESLRINIEAIPSWKSEKEEVELYEMYESSILDEAGITKRMNEVLNNAKERSMAKTLKEVNIEKDIPVYIDGEMMELLMDNFMSETSYKSVFYKINHYSRKDKISDSDFDLTARGYIDGLTSSRYYDSNGVVLKSKKLIEHGTVKNLYGDVQYGTYLDNKNITGNYAVMELANNDKPVTKQAMKKEKHLIVSYFSSPQLDESSGYFGGEVRLAFYYDGEKYIPLTGLSISGNIYEAIKTVKFSKEEYSGRKLKGPKYMILRNIDIH